VQETQLVQLKRTVFYIGSSAIIEPAVIAVTSYFKSTIWHRPPLPLFQQENIGKWGITDVTLFRGNITTLANVSSVE